MIRHRKKVTVFCPSYAVHTLAPISSHFLVAHLYAVFLPSHISPTLSNSVSMSYRKKGCVSHSIDKLEEPGI